MSRIFIPKGTGICIIKPGKKKEDKETYKLIISKKDYETNIISVNYDHIKIKYICLEYAWVRKDQVKYLS